MKGIFIIIVLMGCTSCGIFDPLPIAPKETVDKTYYDAPITSEKCGEIKLGGRNYDVLYIIFGNTKDDIHMIDNIYVLQESKTGQLFGTRYDYPTKPHHKVTTEILPVTDNRGAQHESR